jgi:hypothetical protein
MIDEDFEKSHTYVIAMETLLDGKSIWAEKKLAQIKPDRHL